MYRCPKSGRPWDDTRATDNEFTWTRRCGGGLPYPAALTARLEPRR
jgi:hypothetical protein